MPTVKTKRTTKPGLLEFLCLIVVLSIMAAILLPGFFRDRAGGMLTACKSNLKNIGTACAMYAADNKGQFPRSLWLLTPNYLKSIPTCPAAGRDTYTGRFESTAKTFHRLLRW